MSDAIGPQPPPLAPTPPPAASTTSFAGGVATSSASAGTVVPDFTLLSQTFMINEDALARVLERMQREEGRFRPRWLDWLATGAAFLTIYFALTTASFREVLGIASGDLHTIFLIVDLLLLLATVALFVWWAIYGLTHLHKLTADELVAELKQKAKEQADAKQKAAEKAATR